MHRIAASLDRKWALIVKRLHPEMAFRIFSCFVFETDATHRPLPKKKKTRNTNGPWIVEILLRGADRIDLSIVQA